MRTGLWKVARYYRRDPREVLYPFHVEGVNTETGEAFSWTVPDITDPGYDLSKSVEVTRP